MNNENKQKKRILTILLVSSQSSLSSLRSIRSALLVFLLIFTIIAITPFFISQDVDNNNNNIVNAQKQNDTLPASLLGDSNSSNNAAIVNNDNTGKTTSITTTTTTTAVPTSISLPLSRGYVNGKIGYFIATDVSDNQTAIEISNNQRFKVNFAPSLALIPESSRQQGYEFLNGVKGQGAFGFQLPIASKLPVDKDYSPIVQLNFVKWNAVNNIRELKSVTEIIAAQKSNELTITRTNILINSPAVSTSRYLT
jgi:hypothetical protein